MSKASNLAGFVTSITPTNNLNVGVVTANSLNVGAVRINAGIVTATAFYGDGSQLTGVGGGAPQILTFSPLDEATNTLVSTNVVLTFNQGVAIGTGNITFRSGSSTGTVIQTIGVNSTRVSISGAQVTIDPANVLPTSTNVYVGIPTGAFVNIYGQQSVGVSTYNFTTSDDQVTAYSPANGATNVSYETSITLTFPSEPSRGTGTVEIRKGSLGGTLVESFDALTSNRISISGTQWILDPTNIFLPDDVIYVIIPATAITDYQGLNIGGATKSYSFTVRPVTYLSITPQIAATNVGLTTNFVLNFDNTPARGTGTVELRLNNATGDIIETFNAATSTNITTGSNQWVLDPTDALPGASVIYLIIPSTAIVGFQGLTIGGSTFPYSVTTQNGSLFAWGNNATYGNLGQNNMTLYSSPTQIPGTNWTYVATGDYHGLAIKADETLWGWGHNVYGQIGAGTTIPNYSSPIQIPGTNWKIVDNNYIQSVGIKSDNTLWAWGYNAQGQLGLSNTQSYSSPVQIPGTNWSNVKAGRLYTLATKSDGTLWSWGYNANGQLGLGVVVPRNSPVQIPGTNWSKIMAGSTMSLATKTDGTLWSWGYNGQGALGLNNKIPQSSPIQIPGTTWSDVCLESSYDSAAFALKTDRTLWAWGVNTYGNLGLNNGINLSSPVQVPGTNWKTVSAGTQFAMSLKTDNTLWSHGGYNYQGQLGQNDRNGYSSPRQVPGTPWSMVNTAYYWAAGIRGTNA
jgi:alpha-tubulin suppressor-like RCC1 family protein